MVEQPASTPGRGIAAGQERHRQHHREPQSARRSLRLFAAEAGRVIDVARALVARPLRVRGHSGRLRAPTLKYPGLLALARTLSGAVPASTHCTSCGSMSKLSVAGPPRQWFMPA